MTGQSVNLPVDDLGKVKIAHLPSGLYFLEIPGLDKKFSLRFVKE